MSTRTFARFGTQIVNGSCQQLNLKSDHIYGLKGMGPIPMLKCEAQSDTGRQ